MGYRRQGPRRIAFKKITDVEIEVQCCHGPGIIREEAWQDLTGKIVRYNLAFISHFICQKDNGRVLGYDSAHGYHHRHLMGRVEKFRFASYAELADMFFQEVTEICKESKKED
ncbi:MAG: hypothetical protein WA700_09725 [Acidobacteriaceae bacterium]